MGTTKIEWTDETWNVTGGCTPVSAGCANCAAARSARRCNGFGNDKYKGLVKGSKWTGEIRLYPDELKKPLHWKQPRRVFVDFMSDLFHTDVPFDFIDKVWAVMALCHEHTFQVLTKRPERMVEYFTRPHDKSHWYERVLRQAKKISGKGDNFALVCPLPNVWVGTTTENQEMADKRIPELLKCPAAKRFVSVEPMLGAVDFGKIYSDPQLYRFACKCDGPVAFVGDMFPERRGPGGVSDPNDPGYDTCCKDCGCSDYKMRLDWVICGGESGPGARPMHPDWARSVRGQCKAAGVPFFFKQWGEWGIWKVNPKDPTLIGESEPLPRNTRIKIFPEHQNSTIPCTGWAKVGKKKAGSLLDGVHHKEMPNSKGSFFCRPHPDFTGYQGTCYTSTMRGDAKGVCKRPASEILKNPERWDYCEIEVKESRFTLLMDFLGYWVDHHDGYGFKAVLSFFWFKRVHTFKKWICSEFVHEALLFGRVWSHGTYKCPSPRRLSRWLTKKGYVIKPLKGE
ncbi:hypothetical protein LCGC14_1543190 [marine sediment metagenome]|uniref:Phage protein Gp37/Gp68 n=1 Tax=marine sediment metagenome TaxID=412755 RepID=A0A0F9ISJ8_9ZZZZ